MELFPSLLYTVQLLGAGLSGLGALYLSLYKNQPKDIKILKDFFNKTKLYEKEEDKIILPKLISYNLNAEKEIYEYIFKIPVGKDISDFKKKKKALEHQLKGEIEINYINEKLYIKVFKKDLPKNTVYLLKEWDNIKKIMKKSKLGLCIGFSRRGILINDLTGNRCHLMIAGCTGAGKSVLLRTIIMSVILQYSPNWVKFQLIDLKGGIEMKLFKKAKHTANIAKNISEAREILEFLRKEVQKRLKILYNQSNQTSVYNTNLNMVKYILVVDELAELAEEEDCQEDLTFLLRQARAVGIHVITATQRPDANVLEGQAKANLPVSICLRVKNDINSRIVLDNNEGAYLPPINGRAIYQLNKNIKVQIPFIAPEKAQNIILERNKDFLNKNIIKNKSIEENENYEKENDGWGIII